MNKKNSVIYTKPTEKEFRLSSSETARYRHLTAEFCDGAGVDIGSQGVPVVPWAISFDLTASECAHYAGGKLPTGIHLRGDCRKLPFECDSLDFVYSSHLLEDFELKDWPGIIAEWKRCLKPGGNLIILVPDKELWNNAIANGQPPNCSHKHEAVLGDLTWAAVEKNGMQLVGEHHTGVYPGDYTIMGTFIKL
jgi:SAM-dependent methyltransferase